MSASAVRRRHRECKRRGHQPKTGATPGWFCARCGAPCNKDGTDRVTTDGE